MDKIVKCVKKYFNIAKEFVIKHYKIVLPVTLAAVACGIIIPISVINAKELTNQTEDNEVIAEVEETTEKLEETTEQVVEKTTEQVEEQQIVQTNGEPVASPNLPEGKRYWNPQPAYWIYEDGRIFLPDGTESIDRKQRTLNNFPQFKAIAGRMPNGAPRYGLDLYNFLLTYGTRPYHAMTGNEINEILGLNKTTYPADEYHINALKIVEGTATQEIALLNEDGNVMRDEKGDIMWEQVPVRLEEVIKMYEPISHIDEFMTYPGDNVYIIYNGELRACR